MTPPPSRGFASEQAAEIWLVVCVCGGLSITASIWRLIQSPSGPILFTTPRLLRTIGAELGLAIAFVPFLRGRGWRLTDANSSWRFRDILVGVGLFITAILLYWATWFAARAISPTFIAAVAAMHFQGGQLPLSVVTIGSVINPIFEEGFYLAYTFTALRRYSLGLAFAVAVGLRVAVHVYQGWYALLAIAPMALVFTFYFMRTNRIWPVIVAHAIQDFLALAYLSTHATSQ